MRELLSYIDLSRQELYDLVWSAPVRQGALQFGISDVALAKACKRQQIPLPPRGYWARKAAGKAVVASPLREYLPAPFLPARPTADQFRQLRRWHEEREKAQALASKFAALPIVCFKAEVADALGISLRRTEALLAEGAFPIRQLPYYGLTQRARYNRRRGQTHEARPCWFKGHILHFLGRSEWEQANALELPSEREARTCIHCPVHCPAVHEHSYSRYWRNSWRGRSW